MEQVVQSNSLSLVKRLIETSLVQPSQDTLKITQLDEIGDGNLNIVFRVMLNIGCSVIVKYAPPYIKVSEVAWSNVMLSVVKCFKLQQDFNTQYYNYSLQLLFLS